MSVRTIEAKSSPRGNAHSLPPRYKIPDALLDELNALTNQVTLDLRGMASALWAMSYGTGPDVGMLSPQPGEGLKWLQRELERKVDHIEDVTHRVAVAIRTSQMNEGRGPL